MALYSHSRSLTAIVSTNHSQHPTTQPTSRGTDMTVSRTHLAHC